MKQPNPLAWEESFPPVYGHTSTSFLTRCSGFREAKLGDMRRAMSVVTKCVNPAIISEIRRKYPDAVLLPVITKNKLPEALAKTIGMRTHTGVHELKTMERKSGTAMERLLHKPVFNGKILNGKSYVIVDDVITQGGTVSALRKYIITQGGRVSAIATLSYSVNSRILAPSREDVSGLIGKFGLHPITNVLRYYNIADEIGELTRAQIRYLLCFKDLSGLTGKIEKIHTSNDAYPKYKPADYSMPPLSSFHIFPCATGCRLSPETG